MFLGSRPRTVLPSGGVAITAAEEQERVTVESFTVLTFEPARVSLLCRAQFSISNTGTRLLARVGERHGAGERLLVQLARLGEGSWKGIYSVVSIASFALIIWGFGLARQQPVLLWNVPGQIPR